MSDDLLSEEQMDWTLERLVAWEEDFNKLMFGENTNIDWNKRAFAAGAVRANVARLIREVKEARKK